jgi:hypothetical protein
MPCLETGFAGYRSDQSDRFLVRSLVALSSKSRIGKQFREILIEVLWISELRIFELVAFVQISENYAETADVVHSARENVKPTDSKADQIEFRDRRNQASSLPPHRDELEALAAN